MRSCRRPRLPAASGCTPTRARTSTQIIERRRGAWRHARRRAGAHPARIARPVGLQRPHGGRQRPRGDRRHPGRRARSQGDRRRARRERPRRRSASKRCARRRYSRLMTTRSASACWISMWPPAISHAPASVPRRRISSRGWPRRSRRRAMRTRRSRCSAAGGAPGPRGQRAARASGARVCRARQPQAAAEYLTVETAGDDPQLLFTVAEIRLRGETPEEGLAIVRRLLEQHPDRREEVALLGWTVGEQAPEIGFAVVELAADAAVARGRIGHRRPPRCRSSSHACPITSPH